MSKYSDLATVVAAQFFMTISMNGGTKICLLNKFIERIV
jgi:hypothetical protein